MQIRVIRGLNIYPLYRSCAAGPGLVSRSNHWSLSFQLIFLTAMDPKVFAEAFLDGLGSYRRRVAVELLRRYVRRLWDHNTYIQPGAAFLAPGYDI